MLQKPSPLKAKYSFNVENTAQGYVFTYTGASFTMMQIIGVYAIGAIAMTFYCTAKHFNRDSGIALWLLLSTAVCIGHRLSRKGGFTINQKQLILGSTVYDLDHIIDFYLKADREFFYIGFRYGEQNYKLTKIMKPNSAELMLGEILVMTRKGVQ